MYKYILIFLLITTPALATEIYCPLTKRHLYTTNYDVKDALENNKMLLARDFQPQTGVPEPMDGTPFDCPFDGSPLNGYEFWFVSRGYERPKMAYNGLTIFTKINNKYQWYPYEVQMME